MILKYTRQFYLSAGRTINLYLPYLLLDFTLRLLLFSNFIITDLSDRPKDRYNLRAGALVILDCTALTILTIEIVSKYQQFYF